MEKIKKVLIALAIVALVFEYSKVLADSKGVSLGAKKNASSSVLFCNNMNYYRYTSNSSSSNKFGVEVQLKGGPTNVNVFVNMDKYVLQAGETKRKVHSASGYNYTRLVLYGNSATEQKTGCIATGIVSNQN